MNDLVNVLLSDYSRLKATIDVADFRLEILLRGRTEPQDFGDYGDKRPNHGNLGGVAMRSFATKA